MSSNGVKFSQDARGEIAALASQLNGAMAAIEDLRRRTTEKNSQLPQAQAAIFEASQTVSNQTAQVAKLSNEVSADGQRPRGYIWIGDYKDRWTRAKLAALDNSDPITTNPDKLLPGSEFRVLGNMVVRDGLPSNNAEYFQGRKSLGIIPVGTKIRLIGAPTAIDRQFAVQYWVEVALM